MNSRQAVFNCRPRAPIESGINGLAATGVVAGAMVRFGLVVAGSWPSVQAIAATPVPAQTAASAASAAGIGGPALGSTSAIEATGVANHLSNADVIAIIGAVIAIIALFLSVYVYQWSKKDLEKSSKSIDESIRRWSDTTILLQNTVGRIEKAIDIFNQETFALLKEHYVRATKREPGVVEREAVRADSLVSSIQTQGTTAIKEVLERQGIPADVAPALRSQLSAVFEESLYKTRAATDRAREDTLRDEVIRVVESHKAEGITLTEIVDLLGASYAGSDIASAIEALKLAEVIHLTPDEIHPTAVVKMGRSK